MSLRWTAYVAPKPHRGVSKTQNGPFPSESTLLSKKVCYKFLCVKTVSDKVVRHSLAYLSVQEMVGGDVAYGLSIGTDIHDIERRARAW